MTRHGRDQKDLWIVLAACFPEAKQLAERRPQDPAIFDRNGRAIDFEEIVVAPDDADARAEILLLMVRVVCDIEWPASFAGG